VRESQGNRGRQGQEGGEPEDRHVLSEGGVVVAIEAGSEKSTKEQSRTKVMVSERKDEEKND